MKLSRLFPLLLVGPIFLSACTTHYKTELSIVKPESNKKDDPLVDTLIPVTIEVRDELRLLAKTREGLAQQTMTEEQRRQRLHSATTIPPGFEKVGTFHFVGDAEEATKAVAAIAGYKFESYGKRRINMPHVEIHIESKPLIDAIREIGVQTGSLVNIDIIHNTNPRLLRFIYH